MKYKGYNAKRDENEAEIVKALEGIGCIVVRLDTPLDLLVGYRGYNYLLEVKTAKGKLTKDQREFIPPWRGQLAVIRTPEQAIDVVTKTVRPNKVVFNDTGRMK